MSTIQEFQTDSPASLAQAGESVTCGGRRRGATSSIIWSGDGLLVTANHVVTSRG